ncbi:MAG: 6-carboxytetrahydropterin synthase [Flavobacteriales bacterium]|nr:6-carboxytetrahydropterin synthase [Flavobacteriales bacterium]
MTARSLHPSVSLQACRQGSDMATVHISRRERFSAAHKLSRPDWSEERNLEVFGKCANPNWHGHNYELWVTVRGEQSAETSFVTDLSALGRVIREHVIQHVDHRNLDLDVPFMKGRYSSTENLAVAIWEQLESPVKELGCTLHCVKVQETENNYVEYFGG